ncbi:MAG TPA: nucleotidyltransferase family protein [Blastocatellia bacterium]
MSYKAGTMTAVGQDTLRPEAIHPCHAHMAGPHLSSDFSPERRLILCCAATALDHERLNSIKALLETEIDWGCLLKEAERHGVIPLLYSNLDANFPGAVPEPFMSALRDYFRKNLISNLLLTGEMCGILDLLESHGVSAIPFKGPTLAVLAYGDIAMREFRDIDLLVRREDVLKARALLITRGYAPDQELNRAQEVACLKSESEYGFKGRCYLELQWDIVPRNHSFKLNDEELWRHTDHVNIEGYRVASLCSEDLLLLLCAHGSKQSWGRLSLVCDVSELIRARTDMDWDRLFERARGLGGERMLATGLSLANRLLGARLPEAALERINADQTAQALCERAVEQLFGKTIASHNAMKNLLFFIKARERLRDKALCYYRMAFSPTVNDLRFLSLPAPLFFLYYPLRAVRLLTKYVLRQGLRIRSSPLPDAG